MTGHILTFRSRMQGCFALALTVLTTLIVTSAHAADRDRVDAFLNVTGFDVALDSIAFAAEAAPEMLGADPDAFGADWQIISRHVFDTDVMHKIAVDILEQTLDDDMLNHAVEFYASDLGQRLVAEENASHMVEDDAAKKAEGEQILADLEGSERIDILRRMNVAIDASGTSLRALQEVQIRFLMAASAAGVVKLRLDEQGLRAMFAEQEDELRKLLDVSALQGAAWTYRAFSDEDLVAYAEALEHPVMQRVYELLNAVQYEIMANRFEVLAGKMANLHPSQDL